jgi:RimJ/RimL family protein N-acetyltransferase
MPEFRIETERLTLREWRDEDRLPFHAMCCDPRVMATLGPLMSRAESDAMIDRVQMRQESHGHSFWAVERREDGAFLGWCGIVIALSELPIAGLPEIGWRLAHDVWGQGYAREGAVASLDWAFGANNMENVWAITSVGNSASWGLMERLGMKRHHDMDFEHPNVADGSPLKSHITYSIGRDQWRKTL